MQEALPAVLLLLVASSALRCEGRVSLGSRCSGAALTQDLLG